MKPTSPEAHRELVKMFDFDETRHYFNGWTCTLIKRISSDNPSLRVSQIIYDTAFQEEPWDTYARLWNMFYGDN